MGKDNYMDDTTTEHLLKILVELKKQNRYIKTMLFCIAAISTALLAEVLRHW